MKTHTLGNKTILIILATVFCLAGQAYASKSSSEGQLDRALWLARTKNEAQALKIIKQIEKSKHQFDPGLLLISKARIQFQMNQLKDAAKTYDSIPASSEYWLEAHEELAHTYGRMGDYAKTVSTLQTVLATTFDGVIGPEPYFVLTLTYLKTCNYSEIFKATEKFKTQFVPRIQALRKIEKTGTSPALVALQEKLKNSGLSLETAGPLMKELPRHLVRDRVAKTNKSKITSRAIALAKSELKEIETTLNQLQVIEAEVIHRMHLFDDLKSGRTKQGQIASGSDVLKFPVNDEVWLDELESYAAQIEKCPSQQKREQL